LVSPHHSCKATRSVTLDRGPYRVLSAGASRTLFFFFEVVTPPPPPSQPGLGPAMAELTKIQIGKYIVPRMWRLYKTGIGLTTGFIGSHTVTHNYSVYT
jgi:hypothetical protein